jgi:hypothetical protein
MTGRRRSNRGSLRARLKDEHDPDRRSLIERAISKIETGEPAAPAGHP